MGTQILENISRLYQNYTNIYLIRFEDRALANLSSRISNLFGKLGDQRELAFWPELIAALKKFRFDLITTLLPQSSPCFVSDTLRSLLKEAIESSSQFPECVDSVKKINNLIYNLSSEEHPFMKWLNSVCPSGKQSKSIAICLPNTRNVYLTEQFLMENETFAGINYEIISPRQLKNLTFYDQIIF